MAVKQSPIVESTESLSAAKLQAMILDCDYIYELTVLAELTPDTADFGIGEPWVFAQYGVQIGTQMWPSPSADLWTNTTLCLPGVKGALDPAYGLDIGCQYIALHKYSNMARACSLEGLMTCNAANTEAVKAALFSSRASSRRS